VWGLTGTPAPNGLMDLWAQVALLDRGQRLGKNLTVFRDRYYTPGRRLPSGIVIEWRLRPGAADAIKRQIQDICLAMETDGRVTLPPVTYNDILVELPAAARAKYRQFEQDLVVNLTDLFGPTTQHTAANAAAMTGRLSQLTSGFMYVDEAAVNDYRYTTVHTTKVDALKEIVEAAQGSPLLVFYRFKAELEMLQQAFPDSWTPDDKDVFAKWNRGEVPMLLAHPASAGHGLNLQHGGHTVVWTSPTWNLEEYQQANKRLARQGQQHPVVIHHILAKATVDGLVRNRLNEKADVQFDLLAFLESPL
jgi:SNF2 family DNA or RNA helicase